MKQKELQVVYRYTGDDKEDNSTESVVKRLSDLFEADLEVGQRWHRGRSTATLYCKLNIDFQCTFTKYTEEERFKAAILLCSVYTYDSNVKNLIECVDPDSLESLRNLIDMVKML